VISQAFKAQRPIAVNSFSASLAFRWSPKQNWLQRGVRGPTRFHTEMVSRAQARSQYVNSLIRPGKSVRNNGRWHTEFRFCSSGGYRLARFSLYLWVVEAIDPQLRAAGAPAVIGEAIFDSASSERDTNLLAIHVPGPGLGSSCQWQAPISDQTPANTGGSRRGTGEALMSDVVVSPKARKRSSTPLSCSIDCRWSLI
jgi:hypothetical protein